MGGGDKFNYSQYNSLDPHVTGKCLLPIPVSHSEHIRLYSVNPQLFIGSLVLTMPIPIIPWTHHLSFLSD